MQNRIPMNSASLQKNFPEIYQEFFSKCQIAISTTRSFTWFGEQAIRYGGLILRQNLPLRVYVGLIPTKKQSTKITNYTYFNPLLQKFEKGEFDYYQKEKIERYLITFLKKELNIDYPYGFEIRVLDELPHERGLGAMGLFAILILSILAVCNKLAMSEINKWKNASSLDLKNDAALNFNNLFKIIWKWENFIYPGASGSNMINIIPSKSSILFFSKIFTGSQMLAEKQLKLEDLSLTDKNEYWFTRLDEITNQSEILWPFDFGLIHTDETIDVRDSINLIRELNDRLLDNAKECENDLKPYIENTKENLIPSVYKLCQNKEKIWDGYIGSLIVNTIQTYLALKKISKNMSHTLLKELTELINKEQNLFYLLNLSSQKLDALSSALRSEIRKKGQEDTLIGTKISGSTRRGDIVFLVNSYHIRNKIEEIISELREKFGQEICLDYASWLDGYDEEGGVRVEQFWQEGIYSQFVPEDSLILTEFKGDEKNTRVITYDKLKKDAYTLLLDTLENKILIKGRALTSKDLPTQAATIQILKALLESDSRSLSNRSLPSFSYTKYRNEMQGKIVTPLVKLTDGKVKISLDGGLMDFIVKLETAKSVKIGILEKIK